MMIADLATKRPPAIVEALNSNEWRHASSTKLFTKPTDIFMKVNNGRMTWLKNDNNPSHCIKCLNVYCGQAISLNLQFEFHCKCYFCSTYPQLGLVEPIFSDMDEKTLPLLNVSAVYLNSIIIAEMSISVHQMTLPQTMMSFMSLCLKNYPLESLPIGFLLIKEKSSMLYKKEWENLDLKFPVDFRFCFSDPDGAIIVSKMVKTFMVWRQKEGLKRAGHNHLQ